MFADMLPAMVIVVGGIVVVVVEVVVVDDVVVACVVGAAVVGAGDVVVSALSPEHEAASIASARRTEVRRVGTAGGWYRRAGFVPLGTRLPVSSCLALARSLARGHAR